MQILEFVEISVTDGASRQTGLLFKVRSIFNGQLKRHAKASKQWLRLGPGHSYMSLILRGIEINTRPTISARCERVMEGR